MNREANNYLWLDTVFIAVVDIFKHFRSILLVTLICAFGADVVLSLAYQPLYKSSATFAMKANNQYATVANMDEVEEISSAFGYIISSNIFKQKIMDDMQVTTLDGYYKTSVLNNTNIIQISAVSSEPKIAYQMMNLMMEHYQELSQLVLGDVNIEIMQDISIPVAPFNPLHHQKNLMLYGGMGCVLSVFCVGMMSYFSRRIKTREDIENHQIPVLGSVPKETKTYLSHYRLCKKKNILINQMSTSFRYIETIKKIRHKIENKKYQVIMMTSCLENEGKTSIIANIALALKENHKKVLLIDADLRKPAIHKIFGLESNDGMRQVLSGKFDVIISTNEGIDCVLGNSSFENASELIESDYFKQFIEKSRAKYDYILIDSAPSAIISDSTTLASMCDGYILVVRQNFIVNKLMEDTVDKLSLSHQPLIGAILNQKIVAPWRFAKRKGRYYHERYGYYARGQKAGEHHE